MEHDMKYKPGDIVICRPWRDETTTTICIIVEFEPKDPYPWEQGVRGLSLLEDKYENKILRIKKFQRENWIKLQQSSKIHTYCFNKNLGIILQRLTSVSDCQKAMKLFLSLRKILRAANIIQY